MLREARRPATALAAAVLLAACGGGCRESERRGDSPSSPAGAPRVVSLHDVTTEIMVALGATDRLVAVGGSVDLPAEVESAVAKLRRVGDAESIIALHPNLVLGTRTVAE